MVDESGNKIMDSEGVWFKNQDEFVIWVNPAFEMAKNWTYGSILQFRSQFVNGYKSRSEQEKKHLKSKFMTPGYLDISLGITYKAPKEISDHGQHVSARLERHLCRKRLDPHAAGGR